MSEMLKKARAYEAEKAAQTDKNTRPLFHISAPAGWINDPNGFSVYDGKIHLFYQYYPYAREWGPMHWGHSVTTDMISWEQLPAASPRSQPGCFHTLHNPCHPRMRCTGSVVPLPCRPAV